MRLGWRPGNEAGVEAWERGWGGDLGMRLSGGLGIRLGWRPGNEVGVEAWECGWGGGLGTRLILAVKSSFGTAIYMHVGMQYSKHITL